MKVYVAIVSSKVVTHLQRTRSRGKKEVLLSVSPQAPVKSRRNSAHTYLAWHAAYVWGIQERLWNDELRLLVRPDIDIM